MYPTVIPGTIGTTSKILVPTVLYIFFFATGGLPGSTSVHYNLHCFKTTGIWSMQVNIQFPRNSSIKCILPSTFTAPEIGHLSCDKDDSSSIIRKIPNQYSAHHCCIYRTSKNPLYMLTFHAHIHSMQIWN